MAAHQQPSPNTGMHQHRGPPPGHVQPNGHDPMQAQAKTAQWLTQQNENVWLMMGHLAEQLGDVEGAIVCYERAIQHNQWSVPAMSAISQIYRAKDQFGNAVEYLRQIIKIDQNNGETWGSLGHCYLMLDDLQQAYSAYQQALYHLHDPKEPKLWYGIGILYDRYGSLEHAEEAFAQVMRMEPKFDKANEIYFRLGIIYKQQQKFQSSLDCFKYIVHDPPRPLTEEDIWFQIGHVHEQQKDYDAAKHAYQRVLQRDPGHAKVLQQLGWLHHQQSSNFASQEQAIEYLEKSVASDGNDAQSWYLLGRCYMSQQKYPKAYEAYQQAVYRDGRNPTFWCSIGVLYYQINQYRDALDAYSRAIRLNPNISEVWYDLGTLYESCNNQTNDALDAYQRAAELDPSNVHIKARLQLLQSGQPTSGMPNQNSAPTPQDVHPQAYQPASVNGPPGPQWGGTGPGGPSQAPAPPAMGGPHPDWNRRLADMQNPQMPPQQVSPYEQREVRPPGPHAQRPATPPRGEHMRQYPEPPRSNPPRRGLSPSPKTHHAAPNMYPGPQGMPPQAPPPQHPMPQPQQPPQNRITNPNYGGHSAGMPTSAPPSANGPPTQGPLYRGGSPPPEIRPIIEHRPTSASGGQQPYQHAPNPYTSGGIASGAPPPASALSAAEAAARERDERAPNVKRPRDWEDEGAMPPKPPSNDEKRPRLDEHAPRRPSPPERMASDARRTPPDVIEARRATEEQHRRMAAAQAESYQPSAAAHHPHTLPSLAHAGPPSAGSPSAPASAHPLRGPHTPLGGPHPPPPQSSSVPPMQQHGPHPPPPPAPTSAAPHAGPMPAMAAGPPPPPPPPQEPVKEERKESASALVAEPAARKVDVDENYDDSGDDEKRGVRDEKGSPARAGGAGAGVPANGVAAAEVKA